MKRLLSYLGLICFVSLTCSSFCFENKNKTTSAQKEVHFKKDDSYIKERLYDIDFNERFDLYYSDTYCFVVDLSDSKQIYSNNDFSYPYTENISYHIFNDSPTSDFKFFCSDGTYLWQPEYPECRVDVEEAMNGNHDFEDACTPIYDIYDIPDDATLIENASYFIELENNHSYNPDNRCCLVAIQILAGYYDNFFNDDYVPEEWDCVSAEDVSNDSSWENWLESPGAGHISNPADSRMLDYLTNYTVNNVNSLVTTTGLTFYQQKNVLDYYLYEQCVGYTLSYCEGNLNDYLTQYNKAKIKSGIDNNYPVIANGAHHSTVAFAYDDDYVYVHTGWGYCAYVSWSVFTNLDYTYNPSSMYVIPSNSHTHSNNYYSNNHFYCSCGATWNDYVSQLSQFPIAQLPSTSNNYFYHYYDSTTIAIISYRGIYKDSNNHLIMTGSSELSIMLMSGSFQGITIEGIYDNSFSIPSTFKVDFLTSSDDLDYSYNAKAYSKLSYSSLTSTYLALNCHHYIRTIKISILKNNVLPWHPVLDISKLTISLL